MRKQALAVSSIAAIILASSTGKVPWHVSTTLAALLTLALAYLRFENTVASTRVISVLGVLTAVAVVLRQAVHGLGASPIFSIIILTGFVFGWVEGFIVGSTVMLASNFMVGGHGPWTPYQMVAAGLVGALAAAIPKGGGQKTTILLLAVYAVFSAFVYGAITDVFFWLAFTREHTPATYLAVHLAGVLNNTARAVGNILFIMLIGPAVIRTLSRFKNRFYVEYVS